MCIYLFSLSGTFNKQASTFSIAKEEAMVMMMHHHTTYSHREFIHPGVGQYASAVYAVVIIDL